jgi:hypothetical protein
VEPGAGSEGQTTDDGGRTADENWKFRWKKNGLRHSFISYRVAAVQDVAKVSLEAGNSPQMIFKHYRELVRPKEAEEWFEIKPESRKKAEIGDHRPTDY